MNYQSFTVPQLKALAEERGVYSVRNFQHKAEIVWALERRDAQERIAAAAAAREAAEEAHRQTRQLGIPLRSQDSDELQAGIYGLKYPFSFLRNGDYARDVSPIVGQPDEDIGNFPENIAEYYWVRNGANDEEPWLALCRLTNGVYVFYKGECDYTGFDCQGSMDIYASRSTDILLQYAMTTSDYQKYIADTDGGAGKRHNRDRADLIAEYYDYATYADSVASST